MWLEGGGMVTGTDDPAVARPLILTLLAEAEGWDPDDDPQPFPSEQAQVQRGRIVPVHPDSADADEGYAWRWHPVREGDRGPGITTAVVWWQAR